MMTPQEIEDFFNWLVKGYNVWLCNLHKHDDQCHDVSMEGYVWDCGLEEGIYAPQRKYIVGLFEESQAETMEDFFLWLEKRGYKFCKVMGDFTYSPIVSSVQSYWKQYNRGVVLEDKYKDLPKLVPGRKDFF